MAPLSPPEAHEAHEAREALIGDYVAAEDALRAFTDRNFGRMCAACARWTLFAARTNESAAAEGSPRRSDLTPGPFRGPVPGDGKGSREFPRQRAGDAAAGADDRIEWALSSWVTNCCNANHALESMSDASLAGIVASREEGAAWWQKVKQQAAAPCRALTETGCYLTRGRPELCNRYFCEAVRDYLWLIGGDRDGARLAGRLDDLQRRWATLYAVYQSAIVEGGAAPPPAPSARATPEPDLAPTPGAVRGRAGWAAFLTALEAFDADVARFVRPVTADEMAHRLFKVSGPEGSYRPFWEREMAAIGGQIRRDEEA